MGAVEESYRLKQVGRVGGCVFGDEGSWFHAGHCRNTVYQWEQNRATRALRRPSEPICR